MSKSESLFHLPLPTGSGSPSTLRAQETPRGVVPEKDPRRLKIGSKPDLTAIDDTVPVAYSPSETPEREWSEIHDRPGLVIKRTQRWGP